MLCQKAIEKKNQMEWSRVGRMTVLGAFLVAPALHVWYGYLHRLIPATTTVAAIQRLALDQTIFGPLFIPVFFSSLFALEGRVNEIIPHLKENYVDNLLMNWKLWIPGNFVNFRFVAPQFQVLFANAVALVWNTYLSYSGHQDHHEDA